MKILALTADTMSVGDTTSVDDDPLSGKSRFGLLDVINNVGRHDVVLVVRDKKGMKKIIDLIMSTDVWRPYTRGPKNKKFLVVRKATIGTLSEGLTAHCEDGELCMGIKREAGNNPAVVNISLKTFRGGDFEVWAPMVKRAKEISSFVHSGLALKKVRNVHEGSKSSCVFEARVNFLVGAVIEGPKILNQLS